MRSARYVTHCHNFEIQNVLVSKRRMLLSWKVVNRNKFGTSLCTVAHICHGKTYFPTAKLTFPRQNLLSHGKTYFLMAKLTFPLQNFIKGLGRDLFLNRIKMTTAYSDNEDGVEDSTEEVLIKLKYYFYRGCQYKDILDFLRPPYRPPCWIDCS